MAYDASICIPGLDKPGRPVVCSFFQGKERSQVALKGLSHGRLFLPLVATALRFHDSEMHIQPDSLASPAGKPATPGAPPHRRCDSFQQCSAATPLARHAAPPGAIRDEE